MPGETVDDESQDIGLDQWSPGRVEFGKVADDFTPADESVGEAQLHVVHDRGERVEQRLYASS
ncbi:hypothetical protein [Streptomyces nigrescens]|uniref:hypothetical protein n=1 Tax=Streptomyces nigrescens TaxID=1920 RepID=UPI00346BB4DC